MNEILSEATETSGRLSKGMPLRKAGPMNATMPGERGNQSEPKPTTKRAHPLRPETENEEAHHGERQADQPVDRSLVHR